MFKLWLFLMYEQMEMLKQNFKLPRIYFKTMSSRMKLL